MKYPQVQIGIIYQDDVKTYLWEGKELTVSKSDAIYEMGFWLLNQNKFDYSDV